MSLGSAHLCIDVHLGADILRLVSHVVSRGLPAASEPIHSLVHIQQAREKEKIISPTHGMKALSFTLIWQTRVT